MDLDLIFEGLPRREVQQPAGACTQFRREVQADPEMSELSGVMEVSGGEAPEKPAWEAPTFTEIPAFRELGDQGFR